MMRWSNSVACRDEGRGRGRGRQALQITYVRTYVRTYLFGTSPLLGQAPLICLGQARFGAKPFDFFGTTWDIPFKIVGTVRSWDGLAK